MKLILFIGHFKTGSTSVQSFLSSNFLALLKSGILYPSVESQGISRNLAASMMDYDKTKRRDSFNIIEPHNALSLRLKNEDDGHSIPTYYPSLPTGFQMLELIENQISELNPKATILCSEVFSLLGMTASRSGVKRLARRFAHHDVTIYCNLRQPDELISSWHRQLLKFGAKIARLSDDGFKGYLDSPFVQQAKMIEGWTNDCFPNAKLILRNFDDVRKNGGSILDFKKNSTIKFPNNLRIPRDRNPSIPSAFFEIGRRANHELSPNESALVNKWLISARKRVIHPLDKDIEMYGRTNRDTLCRAFSDISERINSLSGKNDLFSDLSEMENLKEYDDLTAAKAALSDLKIDGGRHGLPKPILLWLRNLQLN